MRTFDGGAGALLIDTVTPAEVLALPRASQATAVIVCVPVGRLAEFQDTL